MSDFSSTDVMTSPGSQIVPHSREAEEAVIGAILINPEAYYDVASFLQADDFYIIRHRWVWQAFNRLHEQRVPIDFLTVTEALDQMGQLAEAGGPAYLTALINNVPTSLHAEAYGHVVEETAVRRRMLGAMSRGQEAARELLRGTTSGQSWELAHDSLPLWRNAAAKTTARAPPERSPGSPCAVVPWAVWPARCCLCRGISGDSQEGGRATALALGFGSCNGDRVGEVGPCAEGAAVAASIRDLAVDGTGRGDTAVAAPVTTPVMETAAPGVSVARPLVTQGAAGAASTPPATTAEPAATLESATIDRWMRRSWTSLAVASFLSTAGMSLALAPLLH